MICLKIYPWKRKWGNEREGVPHHTRPLSMRPMSVTQKRLNNKPLRKEENNRVKKTNRNHILHNKQYGKTCSVKVYLL